MMGRRALLACGIFSSFFYVATDMAGALIWDDYSYASQNISELLAIGAPTRPLLFAPFLLYNLFVFAFAAGAWRAAGQSRPLRIAAGMLFGYGIASSIGPFVPMHVRGTPATLTDTLHIVDTLVISLFMVLAVAFGAAARGKAFRAYSIATLATMFVFGPLTGLQAPRLAANLPTPWMGLTERVNIYATMLWIAVLSIYLLRVQDRASTGPFVTNAAGSRRVSFSTPA
jgi:hypothetical protein